MMADSSFPPDLDGEDSDPIVTLKSGVDLQQLCSGTEFEVDLSDIESSAAEVQQFDSSNVYKFFKEDILDREDEDDDDDNLSPFERVAAKMENVTPDGGVKKQMLQHGIGDVVPPNAHVTVHYNGYFEYADEPFDSSRLRLSPLSFDLGSGAVLPGFDIAVASMRKKEQARFLIKPSYAMGEIGCPPRIPGGATCLYVLELLHFFDVGGVGEYFSMPMSERNDAPFELVTKAVKKTKQEAKTHYDAGRYNPAAGDYRRAINILEQYHLKSDEEEGKQKQILLQLYQNLALCKLKLGHCGQVIQNANEALRIQPNSFRALYFKGKALRQQGHFDMAKTELMKANALYPRSTEITEELQKLERGRQAFHLDEKKMYRRMFAASDDQASKEESVSDKEKTPEHFEELSQMFSEKLKMFVDDPELMEIPYSTATLTLQELGSIELTAKKMGLLVLRKQQDNNVHIRICKHKSAIQQT